MLIQDNCALANSQEYIENKINQSIEKIIPIAPNAPCSKGRTPMNGPPKSFYWYSESVQGSGASASTIAS